MGYMGIDPSTKSTGWSVFSDTGELADWGVIRPDSNEPLHERLKIQYDELSLIVNRSNIQGMLCEDQFAGNNIATLKALSQTRGIVMLVAAQNKIDFQLAQPKQWRKIFLGDGKATKRDCVHKVNEMFGLKLKMVQNDIAEAIGIGYTMWKSASAGVSE